MKPAPPIAPSGRRSHQQGFTLTEMMVVMVIFSFIVLAIVAVQIFALRVYKVGTAKLTTTTDARETMNAIRDQIRSCKLAYVGTYTTGGGFSRIASGSAQQGNALEIANSNNTNIFQIYYLDTTQTTNTLYSISNNVASTRTTQARFMTNYNCFIAEDYRGTVLFNYVNNPVIHVIFQFNEQGYPAGLASASNNVTEFYYLSSRVMRRSKE